MRDVAYMPTTTQQGLRAPPQVQSVGGTPLENLIMDFTEMPLA
jgi:hypothetical protein